MILHHRDMLIEYALSALIFLAIIVAIVKGVK